MLISIVGCDIVGETVYTEIERIQSPDKKVEVVIVTSNGGATTSIAYHIYIVQAGKEYTKGFELLTADHVSKCIVAWKKDKLLTIKYKNARIFHFSNFWHSDKLDNWKYVVELRLEPSTEDFSLDKRDRGIL